MSTHAYRVLKRRMCQALGLRADLTTMAQLREAWWAGGRVCAIVSVRYEEPSDDAPKGRWRREFVPVTCGDVWTRYDGAEAHYKLYEGVPMATLASGTDERSSPRVRRAGSLSVSSSRPDLRKSTKQSASFACAAVARTTRMVW